MVFWLAKPGEQQELKKLENLIKRLPLICTYLLRIAHESESGFAQLTRTIPEGYKIVERMGKLKYKLRDLLHTLTTLLQFIENRNSTIQDIDGELRKLKEEFGVHISINEFTIKHNLEELREIILQEQGDLKLIKHLHKKLIDVSSGDFKELFDIVKGEQEAFPREQQHFLNQFLFYLKKLIGAFHEISKIILRVERLEDREEANFGYFYSLLGEPKIVDEKRTALLDIIRQLEAEFNKP